MEIKSTKIEPRESLSEKTDLLPGLGDQDGLSTSETKSFLGIISSVFQKIKSYIESPEAKVELEEQQAKEDFKEYQYDIVDKDLDRVISLRKEYGFPITPAVQDYIDFVQDRDDVADAYGLTQRAKKELKRQIIVEEKGYKDILELNLSLTQYSDSHNEEENTINIYGEMSQEEYNAWRLKVEEKTENFIKKMDKMVSNKPGYMPDTINSVLNYRLYQILKNSDKSELREKLEKQFQGELVGNNLDFLKGEDEKRIYPEEAFSLFTDFQNALIANGLLSPDNNFISKNAADKDLYQKGFEKNSGLEQKENLVFATAKDKELLREGKFDELLKKDYGEFLNKQIMDLQALKANPDSDKKMYQNQLEKVLGNFSEYSIISFLGGDIKNRKIASSEEYHNYVKEIHETINTLFEMELGTLSIDVVGNSLKRKIDNFNEFRKDKGLPLIDENFLASKTISEISKKLTDFFKNERSFGISDKEKGEKLREDINEIFLLKGSRQGYEEFILKKLNSDFDKLYKETNKQKDLGSADKKALVLFEDIKKGLVDASNEIKEIKKRFSKEIKNYDKIEWQANPFATTMLQAVGFLNEALYLSDGTDEFKSFRNSIKALENSPYSLVNKIKNDGLKEKNKVIDVNIEFIREVADGKHQKFIEKVIDLVKDQYQGPVNMQALVTQVYTRGAKAVIAKEGLDGRTKAAKFIESVEKTIKSISEPSL
jgi:hypothetical protein